MKQAKEGRQNIIQENRIIKQEEEKMNDLKQLVKIIQELRRTLDCCMETTTKEIENIKKAIGYSNKDDHENDKSIKIVEKDIETKIQNIINQVKEIDQRNKTLETSQIPSDKKKNTRVRHWKNNDSNNRNYPNKEFKLKNKAYNKFKENFKSVMNKDKQTIFTLQKEIAKAVLIG